MQTYFSYILGTMAPLHHFHLIYSRTLQASNATQIVQYNIREGIYLVSYEWLIGALSSSQKTLLNTIKKPMAMATFVT